MKRWIILLALCLVGVPLVVYWFGGLLVGPYEGDGGFTGMLGQIYGSLLAGRLSAWFLIFSPVLLLTIWVAYFRLQRSISQL